MKVLPEKRKELTQALVALMEAIRWRNGCVRCECYASVEDQNQLCLRGEWACMEDLALHLRSDLFRVLLGAMSLLQEPHAIQVHTAMAPPEAEILLSDAGGG